MKDKNVTDSEQESSLEPPPLRSSVKRDSSSFLRRQRSHKSSQLDDSEAVSPRFDTTKTRFTNQSGDSNTSNLEDLNSAAFSPLSTGKEFHPNVVDWNEKVPGEKLSSSGLVPRHAADPPRPAREGFEWVWFPEGYWAERKKSSSHVRKKESRKWFRQPLERQGNQSPPPTSAKGSMTPSDSDISQINVERNASNSSSSQTSHIADDKVISPSTPGSRIKKGLSYVSPTHPHFTSPAGQPEGLYCKVKRGVGIGIPNRPRLYSHDTASTFFATFPTRTILLLEGTSNYLDQQLQDQRERRVNGFYPVSETPQTPISIDGRPRRRFGLAPWHRKTSQESLLSVSSSVHRLLMGKAPAPAATPTVETSYEDYAGLSYEKVEISEPGQPTFLPSEARRVRTPPMSAQSSPKLQSQGLFFNSTSTATEEATSGGSSSGFSTGAFPARNLPTREPRSSPDWWKREELAAREAARHDLAKRQQFALEMSLPPEHLPNSPLCPRNSMHKSQGLGICAYHGRRGSSSLRGSRGDDSSDSYHYDTYDPHEDGWTMASSDAIPHDALLLLRQSIASESPCIPTKAEDASSASSVDLSLATASFLQFTAPVQVSIPLTAPTRFISSNKPVDLRSIYFAWLKRETAIPEYNASAISLNAELAAEGGAGGEVQNLAFVERLDLITWLEGASEESEYVKPLASDTLSAAASAQVASGAKGGIAPVTSGAAGRGKTIDPRLAEIYNGERKMGDRNSVLRGIKPTDFSHVRKLAAPFNARKSQHAAAQNLANNPALAHNPKTPARRPDPIILLSPSASSLLRMSNIKSFLEAGVYIPADSSSSGSSSSASILHMERLLPSIDTARPIRFIIVDTPEQFKPEYWSRVVAVFTTGQVWQFKSYKWQQPIELFRQTLGVYVGWRGEHPPDTVKGWGRGVLSAQIDKYNIGTGPASRWRDREVVEGIWKSIEDNMRSKGWRRDSGPMNV
ncbi:Cell division control 73 [Hyphodiscus hymeniophilus]|uniref:Cell division control 73 n=1 Tax=Hyphodiscus hymeniophilus TaxID=353542 RepID=A0A9P6VJJ5_9HELO|nr:Cell division control 73 [Hyphodiscus hymeniophilus]